MQVAKALKLVNYSHSGRNVWVSICILQAALLKRQESNVFLHSHLDSLKTINDEVTSQQPSQQQREGNDIAWSPCLCETQRFHAH